MRVSLLNYTHNPLCVIYAAACTCYSSLIPDKILSAKPSKRDMQALIKKLVIAGHHSVLERAVFTFSISNISRSCSHQLVRHRIASYSQQSQRYVAPDVNVVIPPSISNNKYIAKEFTSFVKSLVAFVLRAIAVAYCRQKIIH